MITSFMPVMTSLNLMIQGEEEQREEEQKKAKQREEMERNQEIAHQRHNVTSCVQYEYGAKYACCFYEPLPPETQANMVAVCGAFEYKTGDKR